MFDCCCIYQFALGQKGEERVYFQVTNLLMVLSESLSELSYHKCGLYPLELQSGRFQPGTNIYTIRCKKRYIAYSQPK